MATCSPYSTQWIFMSRILLSRSLMVCWWRDCYFSNLRRRLSNYWVRDQRDQRRALVWGSPGRVGYEQLWECGQGDRLAFECFVENQLSYFYCRFWCFFCRIQSCFYDYFLAMYQSWTLSCILLTYLIYFLYDSSFSLKFSSTSLSISFLTWRYFQFVTYLATFSSLNNLFNLSTSRFLSSNCSLWPISSQLITLNLITSQSVTTRLPRMACSYRSLAFTNYFNSCSCCSQTPVTQLSLLDLQLNCLYNEFMVFVWDFITYCSYLFRLQDSYSWARVSLWLCFEDQSCFFNCTSQDSWLQYC